MHRLYRFKSSLNRSRKSVDSKHVSIGDRACRIDERKEITSEFFAEGKGKDSQVSRKGERRKRERGRNRERKTERAVRLQIVERTRRGLDLPRIARGMVSDPGG